MRRVVVVALVLLATSVRAETDAPPLRLEGLVADIRRSNPSAASAARRLEAARLRAGIPMLYVIWPGFHLRRELTASEA